MDAPLEGARKHSPISTLRAQEYGEKLYTGVFYRKVTPSPTFDGLARARQQEQGAGTRQRAQVLDLFKLKK